MHRKILISRSGSSSSSSRRGTAVSTAHSRGGQYAYTRSSSAPTVVGVQIVLGQGDSDVIASSSTFPQTRASSKHIREGQAAEDPDARASSALARAQREFPPHIYSSRTHTTNTQPAATQGVTAHTTTSSRVQKCTSNLNNSAPQGSTSPSGASSSGDIVCSREAMPTPTHTTAHPAPACLEVMSCSYSRGGD